jgi:hypothetical protein
MEEVSLLSSSPSGSWGPPGGTHDDNGVEENEAVFLEVGVAACIAFLLLCCLWARYAYRARKRMGDGYTGLLSHSPYGEIQ